MRVKVTQKAIREGYGNNIISVSYCALQNLLFNEAPLYYTTRTEGWGCDIYAVRASDGTRYALTTGYAPFGKIKAPYDLCTCFDNQAANYIHANKYDRSKATLLIQNFVDAVVKHYKGND